MKKIFILIMMFSLTGCLFPKAQIYKKYGNIEKKNSIAILPGDINKKTGFVAYEFYKNLIEVSKENNITVLEYETGLKQRMKSGVLSLTPPIEEGLVTNSYNKDLVNEKDIKKMCEVMDVNLVLVIWQNKNIEVRDGIYPYCPGYVHIYEKGNLKATAELYYSWYPVMDKTGQIVAGNPVYTFEEAVQVQTPYAVKQLFVELLNK